MADILVLKKDGGLISYIEGVPLPVSLPTSSKSAFGELTTSELTSQVHLSFPYNINTALAFSFPGNGGAVTNGDDHANVSTGTNSDGFAFLLSREVLKYNPGQGALNRFTAKYTTGTAGSEQVVGVGSPFDGFFFGYNGDEFGVLRRTRGLPEIRTLQITTASTTAENITITLDGDSDATVAVTNSNEVDVTAREIAAHNFTSLGMGWGALAAGDTVTFISLDAASRPGSYSISASTAAGTYAQTMGGRASSDNWTPQSDWNVDGMNTGLNDLNPSGQTLDQTKGNVYQIRYQWLGYGAICFSIEDAVTGLFQIVHVIRYANSATSPSVSNPTFGLFMQARNLGGTDDITISSSSMGGFIEGREMGIGPSFSTDNLFTIGNVITEEPILTIRNKQVYQTQLNRVRIQPTFLTLTSNLGNASGNTTFRIYINSTPENGTDYVDVSANSSVVEVDKSAVDFDTSTAILQSSFLLSATESVIFDLQPLRNKLAPGTTFMITAQPSKANAGNEVGATFNWVELF